MGNSEMNLSQWVDERMASLNPPLDSWAEWQPNTARALERWRELQRTQSMRAQEDHLDRLLPENVEPPWFVGIWRNLQEMIHPEKLPPLEVTSNPVPVKDIWGLYATDRKSMVYSLALQGVVVAMLFTVTFNKTVQEKAKEAVMIFAPVLQPLKPEKQTMHGGGGGGDRSPIPAAKGRLPKIAPRQFVPPTEVVRNENPKLVMEPTIVGPPEMPNVNMPNIGDPLARIGPPSNGMGSGGGIGSGVGGGIGSGTGAGLGPGSGGGFGGSAFRVGGGVSQPAVISKVDPEYSEEARKAKYSGTVLLQLIVDVDGRAKAIKVVKGVGLGLDEKAIEAVQKWKFLPGRKNGTPVPVYATVEVNFRLL